MEKEDKYEHAKFIIERYDHYNDSVNNKGVFYITINTFLLGGLLGGFILLQGKVDKPGLLWVGLICLGLFSIISSILTIIALNPFLSSGNTDSSVRSLIFFASVSEYKKENFIQAFLSQDEDRKLYDTVNQSWLLAQGLTDKYKKLRVAGWLLIAQFIILIPILFYIMMNIKP